MIIILQVAVKIVKKTFLMNIDTVTLFLFSSENWKRPKPEIDNIMHLLNVYLTDFSDYLTKNEIALHVVGDLNRLPLHIRTLIDNTGYRKPTSKTLCLAISYGGRADIVESCKTIAAMAENKEIKIDQITEVRYYCIFILYNIIYY